MRANHPPFTAVGDGGIFKLLAERLSSLPSGRDSRPASAAAAPGGTAIARPMAETEARDTAVVLLPLRTRYGPGLYGPEGRAVVLSGIWARIAFVGASLFIAGIVVLGDGLANALPALGLILGGGALATFGWRRAWKALESIEPASAGTPGVAARSGIRQTLQQC